MARGHWRRWTYMADIEKAMKQGLKTVKEIAEWTGFSETTVRKHMKNMTSKES